MARFLIINADDFGYCSNRNNGIIKCLKDNAITSISVLANGSSCHEIKEVCLQEKHSVGLHFNITEGYSTSYQRVSSLLDVHNMFRGKFGFRKSLKMHMIKLEDVEIELQSQLKIFRELTGRNPNHIDGHQHIQVLPGVYETILDVCLKEGIPWIRVPVEVNVDSSTWIDNNLKLFYSDTVKYAEEVKKNMANKNIRCTDAFVGMSCMGKAMTIDRLCNLVLEAFQNCEANNPQNSDITCELMVHPGYRSVKGQGGCGDGPDDFSLSSEREHEMDILCNKEWQQFLKDNRIHLCSFVDLS